MSLLELPSTYWFLFAGVLVNRLGSFVLTFLTLYLTGERHLSPSQAGLLLALNGVLIVLLQPLSIRGLSECH